MKKISVFICILIFLAWDVNAGVPVVTTSASTVVGVRVEGRWAFVSFSNQSESVCSKGRVYLDLENEYQKIAYSTALAAYMAGKKVIIRANDSIDEVYGACKLYDIYVSG